MRIGRVLSLVLGVLGCRGNDAPRKTDPAPAPAVARDAATVTTDAAPDPPADLLSLRSIALPIATIDGAYYYSLEAQLDAPLPDDSSPWADDGASNDVGVRPAPHAPAPWSAMVGRELAAYTLGGAPCPVKVIGVFLLERMSAEASVVLGRIEPVGACRPALVSDRGPPTVFTLEDARGAERDRARKALAQDADHVAFLADHDDATHRSEHVYVLRHGTSRFALVTTHRETTSDCGSDAAQENALFALPDGGPPERVAVAAMREDPPEHALDWDHDGRPELLSGAARWDWGMGGATQFAALWPSPGNVDADVTLSYYIGCD